MYAFFAIILAAVWAFAFLVSHIHGWFIHLLLVAGGVFAITHYLQRKTPETK